MFAKRTSEDQKDQVPSQSRGSGMFRTERITMITTAQESPCLFLAQTISHQVRQNIVTVCYFLAQVRQPEFGFPIFHKAYQAMPWASYLSVLFC